MPPPDDPVLRSARREAIIVFVTMAIAMAYTVIYCAMFGYRTDVNDLKFVYGFPDWIFYGIVVPWGACIVFSYIFGAVIMVDVDLGAADGDDDEFGEGAGT